MSGVNREPDYLGKIDEVRARTGLDFGQARMLLEEANWDILDALTNYEKYQNELGCRLARSVKSLLERGNKTKIVIKDERSTVVEFPITAGLVGAIMAPKVALLGAAACFLSRCSLQIQQTEQDQESENDLFFELGTD